MDSIQMLKCDNFPDDENAKRRPPVMASVSFYWRPFVVEDNLTLKVNANISQEYKLRTSDVAKRLQMTTNATCQTGCNKTPLHEILQLKFL